LYDTTLFHTYSKYNLSGVLFKQKQIFRGLLVTKAIA